MDPIALTFIILGATILLVLSEKLRPDLVALLAALALGFSGILTPQETFSGFSRSAVITILAVFILAEGLTRAGVTAVAGRALLRLAGKRESVLTAAVTFAGAFFSLFMNNIAAAVVLLPGVMGATRQGAFSPRRLMMPLAFGTILGGMATLFTTSNLVVSGLLREQGLAGFGIFDFLALGVPIILVGGVYMLLASRRFLAGEQPSPSRQPITDANLAEIYHLKERLVWAHIPPASPLVGAPLQESCLRETYRLNVLAIQHQRQLNFAPSAGTQLKAGDWLWIAVHPDDLQSGELHQVLEFPAARPLPEEPGLEDEGYVLAETVLAPRSALIGQTLAEAHFHQKYGLEVVAIWRGGRPYRTRLSTMRLQFGDALLLYGQPRQLAVLQSERDLVLLNGRARHAPTSRRKAGLALFILAATLMGAGMFTDQVAEIMLAGALAMILLGLLSMDEAYQAIEWRSIFIIAGMLPLGLALTKTGAAATLGSALVGVLGGYGIWAVMAGLVLLTALFSQVIHGAAVAAVMTPVAIQAASLLGADPRSLAMGVALATSLTFLTPLGHPVNILVMGPGGYRFSDYMKVGAPLLLILLVLILALLPLAWPLLR